MKNCHAKHAHAAHAHTHHHHCARSIDADTCKTSHDAILLSSSLFVSVGIVTQELCYVNRFFAIFCEKTRKNLVMRGYCRKIQRNQLRCPGFGRLTACLSCFLSWNAVLSHKRRQNQRMKCPKSGLRTPMPC